MKRILITGGAGFQGSYLVKHFLKKGHKVTCLNTLSDRALKIVEQFKNKAHLVWGSVTDKELVFKTVRDHDCIFHLAGQINVDQSIKNPFNTIDVNVIGTHNVLEVVNLYKKRLIYASSCEVYGAPECVFIDEKVEFRPHSPYAASKAAADRLCFSYFRTYGTDVTIVRPFNIFGPFQKEGIGGAVIPIFVSLAENDKDLIVFGKGTQTRDYMYIDDLVRSYDIVFNHPELKGEAINFGTGVETKIIDIAEYIAKKFGVKVKHSKGRLGEVTRFAADITKAKKLGFSPKVSIWEGIDKYIAWRKKKSL